MTGFIGDGEDDLWWLIDARMVAEFIRDCIGPNHAGIVPIEIDDYQYFDGSVVMWLEFTNGLKFRVIVREE